MRELRDSERRQFQLDFRDKLISHPLISFLEHHTAFENYPTSSILLTAIRKLRNLTTFFLVRLLSSQGRRAALKTMRLSMSSEMRKQALVLGNGPSLAAVDWVEVSKHQKTGRLAVFATNLFLESEAAKTVQPDYLLWSDSELLPETSEHSKELLSRTDAKFNGYFIFPWRWSKKSSIQSLSCQKLFFDDDTRIGWGRSISPLKSRTYGSNAAPKALAVALSMKFEDVLVAGIDQNYFRNYFSDPENRLWKSSEIMALGAAPESKWECGPYRHGIVTRLFRDTYAIHYLESHFRDARVTNLDRDSLLFFWRKAPIDHPYLVGSVASP